MHFLIMLEQTKVGFSVQVPDLAIITYGKNINDAKHAAIEAIRINLEAYKEMGKQIPVPQPVSTHLNNSDFADLLFCYVNINPAEEKIMLYLYPEDEDNKKQAVIESELYETMQAC
ncbi:antitoxin HicB [Candidatus Magnetomoraceae bacterium gMMP-15]